MMHEGGPFGWTEEALRLGAALAAGGTLGLNRNLRGKAAGVRTHALVALGAALVLVTSAQVSGSDHGALTRTIQGVITGIGFIGAGVILHPREHRGLAGPEVRGLTTAASVWVAAALGVASGSGLWSLVLLGVAGTLAALVGGGPLERLARRRLLRRRGRERERLSALTTTAEVPVPTGAPKHPAPDPSPHPPAHPPARGTVAPLPPRGSPPPRPPRRRG